MNETKTETPTTTTYFETERGQFEHKLQREDGGEDHVEFVESVSVLGRLAVKFHAQRDRVDEDQREDAVLERLRRDQPPNFVLESLLGDVASERFGFQCKFDAVALR